jgi:hypothetical protein
VTTVSLALFLWHCFSGTASLALLLWHCFSDTGLLFFLFLLPAVNDLIDALIVGPLSREVKKVAWDMQAAFRECIQHMDAVLMIPNSDKASGPSSEACFPFVTRIAGVVRTMSPGQVRIIPGGWTEPKSASSSSSSSNKNNKNAYFHMVLYIVSRNDDGGSTNPGAAGYRFTICNYAVQSPSTNGYHPKRIAASNLSVQYQTNIVFNHVPKDRLHHTAFWVTVLRPLLVPGASFEYNDGGGNVVYERVLPFLNRQALETTIAQSAACGDTWITVPRNIQDDTHVWLVWSTMRSALRCCGVGLSESAVDEFCLRVRWAACELSCHQLNVGRHNMTAEDAVAVQLACQALGRQASTPVLDAHAGCDNTLPKIRHSESSGVLTANELHTIRGKKLAAVLLHN